MVPKSHVPNGIAKAVCRCIPCVPIIDYGFAEAKTTYGIIGVKVWVYKGDTLGRGEAACGGRTGKERQESRE